MTRIISSVSENSAAASFAISGSAQTPERSPVGSKTRSPAAIASRYDGIGSGITTSYEPVRRDAVPLSALISTINSGGAVT